MDIKLARHYEKSIVLFDLRRMSGFKTVDHWIGFGIWSFEVLIGIGCLCFALRLIVTQRNRTVADMLVMHLCGVELMSVTFAYTTYCLTFWNKIDRKHTSAHRPILMTLHSSLYQSIIMIVLDRVLAVVLVLKYRFVVTKRKMIVVFVIVWLISIAIGLLYYFTGKEYEIYLSWDIISTIVIVISYSYIILSVCVKRKAMHRRCSHKGNAPQPKSSQIKYQIPLFIVLSFVIALLLPDLVLYLRPDWYCIWFHVIWVSSLISDPLIYVIFTKLEQKKRLKSRRESCISISRNSMHVTSVDDVKDVRVATITQSEGKVCNDKM